MLIVGCQRIYALDMECRVDLNADDIFLHLVPCFRHVCSISAQYYIVVSKPVLFGCLQRHCLACIVARICKPSVNSVDVCLSCMTELMLLVLA